MTAREIMGMFGEYLRPRTGRILPRGYERPGYRPGHRKFYAWLRVVTQPEFPHYEKDLMACLVTCTGDVWQNERIAEFEMALQASLNDRPFCYHEPTESVAPIDDVLISAPGAAAWKGCARQTIHNWIDAGRLKYEKRGGDYYVRLGDLNRLKVPKRGRPPIEKAA